MPPSFWCLFHKQLRDNLRMFAEKQGKTTKIKPNTPPKTSVVSIWIGECGLTQLKWVYEPCQFALSFWGGGICFDLFDFSFWSDFYFRLFLVNYEIKQVQPRMNHFDQSERQLFLRLFFCQEFENVTFHSRMNRSQISNSPNPLRNKISVSLTAPKLIFPSKAAEWLKIVVSNYR